ncbi:MAG: hypothetical protein QMC78_01785 [Methanocellales archaeon]|nr:hypothetical protein [Methanocellales archaeon]
MKRVRTLGALLVAMLFIGMIFAPAVAADGCVGCAPDCSSCHDEHFVENVDTDCTSCHTDAAQIHDWDTYVVELEGKEKNKAVSEALKNEDVKLLRKTLIKDGYTPRVSDASVQKVTAPGASGDILETLVVTIPFNGDSNSAQIIFMTNSERTEVGAGITTITENNNIVIEMLTIDDEGAIETHIIENNEGVITFDGETVLTIHTTDYEMCLSVCYFIYATGCGISGYFVCLAACAPFGTAACPVICTVVWAAICWYGGGNCAYLCAQFR